MILYYCLLFCILIGVSECSNWNFLCPCVAVRRKQRNTNDFDNVASGIPCDIPEIEVLGRISTADAHEGGSLKSKELVRTRSVGGMDYSFVTSSSVLDEKSEEPFYEMPKIVLQPSVDYEILRPLAFANDWKSMEWYLSIPRKRLLVLDTNQIVTILSCLAGDLRPTDQLIPWQVVWLFLLQIHNPTRHLRRIDVRCMAAVAVIFQYWSEVDQLKFPFLASRLKRFRSGIIETALESVDAYKARHAKDLKLKCRHVMWNINRTRYFVSRDDESSLIYFSSKCIIFKGIFVNLWDHPLRRRCLLWGTWLTPEEEEASIITNMRILQVKIMTNELARNAIDTVVERFVQCKLDQSASSVSTTSNGGSVALEVEKESATPKITNPFELLICSICRDHYGGGDWKPTTNVCVLPCGHELCSNCFHDFSVMDVHCPVCRTVIDPSYIHPTTKLASTALLDRELRPPEVRELKTKLWRDLVAVGCVMPDIDSVVVLPQQLGRLAMFTSEILQNFNTGDRLSPDVIAYIQHQVNDCLELSSI